MVIEEGEGEGSRVGFSECLSQEIIWFVGQVGMQFQIDGGHGQGWFPGVVNYMNGPEFLKRKLVGFSVDR